MAYFLGVDEAGYGPNLGPLVISATLWKTEQDHLDFDFYDQLSNVVSPVVIKGDNTNKVVIADSKKVYSSGKGLAALERVILAAIRLTGLAGNDLYQLWNELDPNVEEQRQAIPWYQTESEPLPLDAEQIEVDATYALLKKGLSGVGLRLMKMQSVTIFPQRFNHLVIQKGNKGAALSHQSIQLVQQIISDIKPEPVLIICDKHGGRNRYSELLQQYFPQSLVEVYEEGRQRSVYRWGKKPSRVEIQFKVRGESFLPTALASMICKYVREIAMRQFNRFWCSQLPNLKPTAGYPVDAKRFKSEISTLQKKLGIDDELLWRCR